MSSVREVSTRVPEGAPPGTAPVVITALFAKHGPLCPKHTPDWVADGQWHTERLAPMQSKPATPIRSMSGMFDVRPGGRMKLR